MNSVTCCRNEEISYKREQKGVGHADLERSDARRRKDSVTIMRDFGLEDVERLTNAIAPTGSVDTKEGEAVLNEAIASVSGRKLAGRVDCSKEISCEAFGREMAREQIDRLLKRSSSEEAHFEHSPTSIVGKLAKLSYLQTASDDYHDRVMVVAVAGGGVYGKCSGGNVHFASGVALTSENNISLVFSDINMPHRGSLERRLHRHRSGGGDIPKIMIGTAGTQSTGPCVAEPGAPGYVGKPFKTEQIKETIYTRI